LVLCIPTIDVPQYPSKLSFGHDGKRVGKSISQVWQLSGLTGRREAGDFLARLAFGDQRAVFACENIEINIVTKPA
jgi:hypothetical protein